MSVGITYFDHGLDAYCSYYEAVDGEEPIFRRLTLDEARKMAWELMLAGGTREYRTNYKCNHIHNVDVRYSADR